MTMVVDAVYLPDEMEQGGEISLTFSTTVLRAGNGNMSANQNWEQGLHQGTFSFGTMDKADALIIKTHHAGRRGQARGWLLKNWADYSMDRQQIGVGDGVEDTYALLRLYDDAVNPYYHIVTRPIIATLQVWVNSILIAPIAYSFTPAGGLVFGSPPANTHIIEASCEFDLAVKYLTDSLPMNIRHEEAISVPDFSIEEIPEYLLEA